MRDRDELIIRPKQPKGEDGYKTFSVRLRHELVDRMDDIAREAEYSKATLYVYFQSKEEIINAILLSGLVLLKKKLHEAIESPAGWLERYDAVSRVIVRFYDENPTAYDAATGVMPLPGASEEVQKGQADIIRVAGEIDQEMAAFLVSGTEEGVVRSKLPPMETVMLFWAALSGIIHMAAARESYLRETLGVSREEYLAHGARLLLASLTKANM